MPVMFNEPLSFLQRVVEYMEYAPLLQRASQCQDPVQRMEVDMIITVNCDIYRMF